MARTMQWTGSSHTTRSNHDRIESNGGERRDIWTTLLDNVASGKRLPEKNLLVLGGTQDSQKEFIESLSQESQSRLRPTDRNKNRKIQVANQFALGYTYLNVYDSDHEDMLARLSLYTLNDPSLAYAPLLERLLSPETTSNTAVAILLDWTEPWKFLRTLRAWMRLLKTVTGSLSQQAFSALEDNNTTWLHTRDNDASTSVNDSHTSLPLGPGEFDEPIGLPIVVVCQNALAVEQLEKERGYRESHFDFILQYLRTILLKHGAGLIYTMPSQPGQLQPLIHTILGISSGLSSSRMTAKDKAERGLKHNVVDRERVMVPPGWDSWGKIRVLREGFDVEGVSRAWSVEIQPPSATSIRPSTETSDTHHDISEDHVIQSIESEAPPMGSSEEDPDSTVTLYEAQIQDPRPPNDAKPGIQVLHTSDQTFLASQLERLEAFRAEDDAAAKRAASSSDPSGSRRIISGNSPSIDETSARAGAMQEHIGPVQFNMGGIQYDAEDAVRRLKERARPPSRGTPERRSGGTRESTPFSPNSPAQSVGGGNGDNGKDFPVENLEAYFASLMRGGRQGSLSVSNSPRPGGGKEGREGRDRETS